MSIRLTFDRCPVHGFEALSIIEIDDTPGRKTVYATGTRLVGSKSCCPRRTEIWQSRALTARELHDMMAEIEAYAERAG